MIDLKDRVRDYWQAEPCKTTTPVAEPGTKEFFDEIEEHRYGLEHFIPAFAQFEHWRGKKVLEVGVGLGTDFMRFARAGADLTGVDLTEAAVDAVRRRLELEGLDADVRVADAEQLPFSEAMFDLVYAWGVLHHTPDTKAALREVKRVLKPDGTAKVMLYSKQSWLALALWVRWALLRGRPWQSMTKVLSERIESPGTKAFTHGEIRELFVDFRQVELTPWVTPYDRRVAGPLPVLTGPRFGWFVGITAKP